MIAREVTFEAGMHSVDAVQRAAYRLSDRLSCDLETHDGRLRCTLHLAGEDAAAAEATVADFKNEVLDETLRERIRDETREVRNLILALAFSNTGLVDSGGR